MLIEAIYGGVLLAQWGYHRYREIEALEERRNRQAPIREIEVPRVDEGAVYPLIYGRCRVRAPVLAWISTPSAGLITGGGSGGLYSTVPVDSFGYSAGMLFLLGIPFLNGTNRMYQMWCSDRQLTEFPVGHFGVLATQTTLADLTGEGGFENATRSCWLGTPQFVDSGSNTVRDDETQMWIEGQIEFLNGNDEQEVVNSSGTAVTQLGEAMIDDGVDADEIPDFRFKMAAFLYEPPTVDSISTNKWHTGLSPSLPAPQFEVSSYPEGTGLAGTRTVGQEANPADVIYDLLTGELKLGIPHANVDITSFTAAAETLLDEGHGFSMAIEDVKLAEEHIFDICKQIDAVVFVDPTTLKWKIKLIRGDFNPATIPHFTPANATVSGWSLSGHTGVPNKIRVIFEDRQEHYRDNSAEAHNEANAVGQSGEVDEMTLQMRGIKTQAQADVVAARELSARSRPVAKCRITTTREYATTNPGDAVKLTWPEYGVSEMLFRVARVDRGAPGDDSVKLDVIQDQLYVLRGVLDGIDLMLPVHGVTVGVVPEA